MKKIIIILCSFFLINNLFAETLTRKEEINLLNKIGYGVTTEDLNELHVLGYEKWIDYQLNHIEQNKESNKEDLLKLYKDTDFYYNQILLSKKFSQEKENKIILDQLTYRINNNIFSKNRIQEMMLWFWYNHFNTGVRTNTTPLIFLKDYEIKLKNNSLGNFKDLLKIVSSDPSMLTYLNNTDNRFSLNDMYGLNENYAREFLELHTMGVNSGYTQNDVQELAKILSGHSDFNFFEVENVQINKYQDFVNYYKKSCKEHFIYKGFFTFCGDNHFKEDKIFLGKKIKSNNEKELNDVIDIIVSNEKTANFISKKLYIYFLNDKPNQETISKMAIKFQETKGSIKEVLKVLFYSDDFRNSLKNPEKIKDSYTYIVSTLKTELNHKLLKETPEIIDDAAKFLVLIAGTPYDKNTPDGLSIIGKDWLSSARFQEYIYFNENLFNKFLEPSKNEINYELLSEIKGEKIEIKKQVIEFNLSEKWMKK